VKNFRLHVFLVVARRLSFTKAAEELYITQPAVTKQINVLEHNLNTKLFERKGTHIELTLSGKMLVEYGQKIEKLYEQLYFTPITGKLFGKIRRYFNQYN